MYWTLLCWIWWSKHIYVLKYPLKCQLVWIGVIWIISPTDVTIHTMHNIWISNAKGKHGYFQSGVIDDSCGLTTIINMVKITTVWLFYSFYTWGGTCNILLEATCSYLLCSHHQACLTKPTYCNYKISLILLGTIKWADQETLFKIRYIFLETYRIGYSICVIFPFLGWMVS